MASGYDKRYPIFKMRVSPVLLEWLRTYAQKNGVSMAGVVKGQLESLRRKDERKTKQEGTE